MGIGMDGAIGRDAGADIDHGAPLRKARALLIIFRQAVGELVEADGNDLVGQPGRGLVPSSTLMPGIAPACWISFTSGVPSLRLLPDGLVVEDDAGDVAAHGVGRAEQQFAIVAPVVLGVLDPDRIETPLDRAGGFIGGQNALAGGHHCVCDLVQFSE